MEWELRSGSASLDCASASWHLHTYSCLALSFTSTLTFSESQVNQQFVTKAKGGLVWGQMVSVLAMLKWYLWDEYRPNHGLKPTDLGCGTRKQLHAEQCWFEAERITSLRITAWYKTVFLSLASILWQVGGTSQHGQIWMPPHLCLQTNLKTEHTLCHNQIRKSPVECKKFMKCAFQRAAMGFF